MALMESNYVSLCRASQRELERPIFVRREGAIVPATDRWAYKTFLNEIEISPQRVWLIDVRRARSESI